MLLVKKGGNIPELLDFSSGKQPLKLAAVTSPKPGIWPLDTHCVTAPSVTYKVRAVQFPVGERQLHCLQGALDGWHGSDRLPLHSFSKPSASKRCQTCLTVKVTCALAFHFCMDVCSTHRLITSTGHALQSTSTHFSSGISSVEISDFFAGQVHL